MFALSLKTNIETQTAALAGRDGYSFVGMSFGKHQPTNKESERSGRLSESYRDQDS